MDINYAEIVNQLREVANKMDLKDMEVLKDMNISIEEGKKKFAENNELFRLEVNKILREAFCEQYENN